MKNKLWKTIRWTFFLSLAYLVVTTLYFGYSTVNEQKGIYTFYWSGLNAIFDKEKDFGIETDKILKTKLNGTDGPYIIDSKYYLIDTNSILKVSTIPSDGVLSVEVNHTEIKRFYVKRKPVHTQNEYVYEMPEKLIAISDIEGNFEGFYGFLVANKVIDKDGTWIFGNGHLVLNGDFVDRGNQVTQVLWLIYKLEQQAEALGGKVHYILGNHEIMMLQGDVSYADFKYIEAAKQISNKSNWEDAMRAMYSQQSELGKWLRTKNIIERIGSTLFVHAGLNIDHANEKVNMKELNTIARNYYGLPSLPAFLNRKEQLTLSSLTSPYWDRGLAMDFKHRLLFLSHGINKKETSQAELESILNFYGATQIVIGHSIVSDIRVDYEGKVIKIDVRHGQAMQSGLTKGILFEQNTLYKLNDTGTRSKL